MNHDQPKVDENIEPVISSEIGKPLLMVYKVPESPASKDSYHISDVVGPADYKAYETKTLHALINHLRESVDDMEKRLKELETSVEFSGHKFDTKVKEQIVSWKEQIKGIIEDRNKVIVELENRGEKVE